MIITREVMFNQCNEEELVICLDLPLNQLKNTKDMMSKDEALLARVCDIYIDKMLAYMKSVPHITPTQFELNLRHQKIKSLLIKKLKLINKSENNAVNRLVDKCEYQLEGQFKILAAENAIEFKKCQLGFTLGWKSNVNQPNRSYDKFDDRF